MALQLGHSSLGNCGVRRYTAQVSEEETEAQARSLLSAGSLCGAVLLTRAIWVAWDELEGVGLEVPAARPVHSHLCEAGSQCYGNDKMLGAQRLATLNDSTSILMAGSEARTIELGWKVVRST